MIPPHIRPLDSPPGDSSADQGVPPVARLTRRAVASVADWCAVYTADATLDHGAGLLAYAHRDAAKEPLLRELDQVHLASPNEMDLVSWVLSTGRGGLYTAPLHTGQAGPHADLLAEIGYSAVLALPLAPCGRIIGVVAFGKGAARTVSQREIALAQELALHLGYAIEIARLHQELNHAVEGRRDLLAVLSHQLRTPVTSIGLHLELVEEAYAQGSVDEQLLGAGLAAMRRSTDALTRLSDNLLASMRPRSTRAAPKRHVNFAALVRKVASRFSHHPSEDLLLATDFGTDAYPVLGHAAALERVVESLLDNAKKFSPRGGMITLTLQGYSRGVLLSVRDQGIGIPAGMAEKIFEPFQYGQNALERQLSGLGLSLYLARQTVCELGGHIWVESDGEETGAAVHVWLPLDGRPASSPPVHHHSAPTPA